MSNQVSINSDTSTLTLITTPLLDTDPAMEFITGSFKGTVDERRVAVLNMVIPTGTKLFTLRFEFTDPLMASVDIWGTPTYLNDEDRIHPYQEIAGAVAQQEKNPDVSK